MSWTKEKPKVAGWYWYRDPTATQEERRGPLPICISLRSPWDEEPDVTDLHVNVPFMDYQLEMENFHGEWLGPINPQEEKRCGTCRFKGEPIIADGQPTTFFLCDIIKAVDGMNGYDAHVTSHGTDIPAGQGSFVVDGSGFYAALCVEDDFGCEKWATKKPEPRGLITVENSGTISGGGGEGGGGR